MLSDNYSFQVSWFQRDLNKLADILVRPNTTQEDSWKDQRQKAKAKEKPSMLSLFGWKGGCHFLKE
jgi:hypothetical protein